MDVAGASFSQAQDGAGALPSENGQVTVNYADAAAEGTQAGGGQELSALPADNGNLTPDSSAAAHSEPAAPVEPIADQVGDQQHSANPQLVEFEGEFRKAQEDPANFNQWVAVEKLLDKLGDIEKTRQVYDGLLAEYPLCYGYWRKYADAELKHSSPEWATNVFDRAVAAVPYSSDLWGYYCNYKQKIGAGSEEMRQLFEQGIAYVGTDYLAHGLWDKYIKYETAQGAFANVARLYLRVLGCPLKEIDRYLESLKQFAEERPALDLMTAEELASISDGLKQAKEEAASAAGAAAADSALPAAAEAVAMDTEGGEPAESTVHEGGAQAGAEPAVQPGSVSISESEVKAHWLSGVEALYRETMEELSRRKEFETAIKRPYFHVKPLDQNQLTAWNSYIDYVLDKKDAGVIVRLFERCLVACASYPEFWLRYVRYLGESDPESAAGAVQRAQQVHCKRNPDLFLAAAKFHERRGDVAAAREAYDKVLTQLAPGLVEAVVQTANFERRQEDEAAGRKAFEDALAAEEAKDGESDAGAMLAMLFAQFLQLNCNDPAAARTIYKRALKRWTGLRYLWEGAIHFEEHCLQPKQTERVLDLYRRATAEESTASTLPEADVEELSKRYVDFADAWLDPASAGTIADQHADRFSKHAKVARSRKRAAEASAGEENDAKRLATDANGAAAQPDSAATAAAASAAPAASGAYYQDPAAASGDAAAQSTAVAQAAYYPTASAGAYGYGYYQYPQQYGYSYTGY